MVETVILWVADVQGHLIRDVTVSADLGPDESVEVVRGIRKPVLQRAKEVEEVPDVP